MLKYVSYVVMTILTILLTFFGLGPVVFADGTQKERLITLGVVILLYALLVIGFFLLKKSFKSKK